MASTEIKTDIGGKLNLFCDSCDEDGQTNTARSFCFDCEKYFCSYCEKLHAKFARNHKTIAGDDLPEAKELDPLMQCGSHVKHSVEFYCEEHQLIFCRLCRHIKHGDCEVKDFDTACQEFDLETEFNGAVENLHNATRQINEVKYRGLKQLERLKAEAEQRKSFIRNFRKELDELFDQYKKCGDEYDRANMERENAILGSVDVYLKQTEEQMRSLEEAKGKLEDDAVFVSIIKSNQFCKAYTSKIEDIPSDAKELKPFVFHDENVSTLLEKFTVLTHAEQSEHTGSDEAELGEATHDSKNKSFWNIKSCFLIKDFVVTAGDRKLINITACCTMANGELILCDSANNKMMLMNKSLKIICDIDIQGQPFDVAEVNENTVVVTIPDEMMIQFVAINPGLKLENQIALRRECYGITLHEEELYICTRYDTFKTIERKRKTHSTEIRKSEHKGIQIWSTVTQKLLKSIDIVTDAKPLYISSGSDGTNMFLSGGNGKKPVVCMSKEGHVIYKYFDETDESPSNIYSDTEDNLLVRYAGNSAEKGTGLRVIKSGGECVKNLLLEEESPGKIAALHFDKRSDILLIASEYDVEEETIPNSRIFYVKRKTVSKLRMFKLEYY